MEFASGSIYYKLLYREILMSFNSSQAYDVLQIKADLSKSINDLDATYKILKKITQSDNVEILFQDNHKEYLLDKVKGTKIAIKYLDDTSILGYTYTQKKSHMASNVESSSRYNVAIDNPFKVNIHTQITIYISLNSVFAGILRFSRSEDEYDSDILKKMNLYENSFRDIFLNEIHQASFQVNKNPFSLKTIDVYQTLKSMYTVHKHLATNTENPELLKLLQDSQDNINTILSYLNTNSDNISRVKKQLRNFNGDHGLNLRVLIADDVHINVKMLNAMIQTDHDINEILFAYDGIETMEVLNRQEVDKNINILFLDHHMPGKLGSEIAKELKASNNIKIIIVSITNDPEAIRNMKHLYDYTISKPFFKNDIETLLIKIKNDYQL